MAPKHPTETIVEETERLWLKFCTKCHGESEALRKIQMCFKVKKFKDIDELILVNWLRAQFHIPPKVHHATEQLG